MDAPFRADHVGSLLRPPALKQARESFAQGRIGADDLKAAEDRAIGDAVAAQEAARHHAITDGEFRRGFWHLDFLTGFEGIVATKSNYGVSFTNRAGEVATTSSMIVVNGKIGRSQPVMVDHFAFLKAATRQTAKFCIPAPTYLHMRGGRKIVDRAAYPDMDEFWADIVKVYRAEIDDLVAAGCTYLQLDDVSFACLCDEKIRAQVAADGEDPASLPSLYADIVSALVAARPTSLRVAIHTCRGNHNSMWMASGGYEAVADALFNQTDFDGYFLEYDRERAGGFEPLRFLPKGKKKVVLGLIDTKEPELDAADALKRRVEEATKYVALDQLCLSPQCGFASTVIGNRIDENIQRRKLEQVVEVAEEIWGSSV